jgi:hypothetical protein
MRSNGSNNYSLSNRCGKDRPGRVKAKNLAQLRGQRGSLVKAQSSHPVLEDGWNIEMGVQRVLNGATRLNVLNGSLRSEVIHGHSIA